VILALKTAGDPTEIYLLDDSGEIVNKKIWDAERRLAHDLLGEIDDLLSASHSKLDLESSEKEVAESDTKFDWIPGQARDDSAWDQLSGIIIFQGPGSFTGLRIGITTANAIACAQNIPIIGTTGENWLNDGLEKLKQNQNDKIVMPEYGAEPNITKSKK